MEQSKKVFIIIGVVCAIIVASFIGWYVYRFIWGIIIFSIFFCGGVVGFGIGRLFPKKNNKQREE